MKELYLIFIVFLSPIAFAEEEDFCGKIIGSWQGEKSYPEINSHSSWVSTYHPDGSSVVAFTMNIDGHIKETKEVGSWQCKDNILTKFEGSSNSEPKVYEIKNISPTKMHYSTALNSNTKFEYIAFKVAKTP